jgi:carboxyl-terminal processing protease
MRTTKNWQLMLVLIVMAIGANAQVADSIYYNRLYYTCKVWGHVKYYHTEIANGNIDWDNVLLASVNAIKTAPDNLAFNDSLLAMLNQAGEMGTSSDPMPAVPDSLNNNTDLSWILDPVFSDPVKAILETIRVRFRPQNNIYVSKVSASSVAITFKNDDKYYPGENYPNEGQRILALFRYWNIIHYFYPYKNIMDQSWETSLKEFTPKIVGAQNALSYNLAFKEFTTRINDSHAYFSSSTYWPWHGQAFPPFLVRFIENEMVITKVLPGAEVAQGDIIKKIDGANIYDLRNSLRKYIAGSNDNYIEKRLNDLILWGEYGSFSITVSDGKNEKTFVLSRNSTNDNDLITDSSPIWQEKTGNGNCHIGIVDMGRLDTADVQTMFNDLWNTDAIIFDIRNYPQGTLGRIVNYLYKSPIYIANFTAPDITYPGRLYWHEEHIGKGMTSPYSGKIVILFDERTISQAEYTCMGMEQFPNVTKIGSTTAAADGNVASIYLPGEIVTNATFLGTYYPDYTGTQRVGIIPDIEVLPTIQGIRNGKDEVMDFALNCGIFNSNAEIAENETIKLYPNPTKDYIHYEISSNKPILFEIYDILGRKQKTINKVMPSGIIDISGLKSGIYTIKILANNNIQTIKIIKN